MQTLVIDTATKACSVALYDGEVLIDSFHEVIGRGHAERLLPLIAKLPACGKADRIVVDVGPGSFTGIRVGVAAARALGLAWNVEVTGYGCLALVAAMARQAIGQNRVIDVVMTGGHGEYFFQSFDPTASELIEPVSLTPERLAEQSQASVLAGDVGTELTLMNRDYEFVDLLPNASCWHLVAALPAIPPSPVYGRAPDAKLPKAKLA